MKKLLISFFSGVILTFLSYFYYNLLFFEVGGRGFPLPFYFFKDWDVYSFSFLAFVSDIFFWGIISFFILILIKKLKRKT